MIPIVTTIGSRIVELEDGVFCQVQPRETVPTPPITYLDEVEMECWDLFGKYASIAGVDIGFDEDGVYDSDLVAWPVTKAISEGIISLVEDSFGIKFPVPANDETPPFDVT